MTSIGGPPRVPILSVPPLCRQRAGAHPRVLELEARTDSCSNQFDYGTHYHQTAEASEEARAAAAKTLEAAHAVSLKVVAETKATIESDGLERHHQGAHGKAGYDSLGYMPKLAVSEAIESEALLDPGTGRASSTSNSRVAEIRVFMCASLARVGKPELRVRASHAHARWPGARPCCARRCLKMAPSGRADRGSWVGW